MFINENYHHVLNCINKKTLGLFPDFLLYLVKFLFLDIYYLWGLSAFSIISPWININPLPSSCILVSHMPSWKLMWGCYYIRIGEGLVSDNGGSVTVDYKGCSWTGSCFLLWPPQMLPLLAKALSKHTSYCEIVTDFVLKSDLLSWITNFLITMSHLNTLMPTSNKVLAHNGWIKITKWYNRENTTFVDISTWILHMKKLLLRGWIAWQVWKWPTKNFNLDLFDSKSRIFLLHSPGIPFNLIPLKGAIMT